MPYINPLLAFSFGISIGALVFGLYYHLKHKAFYFALESKMLKILYSLAMAHDNETGNHILRTQAYVKILAKRRDTMGVYGPLTKKMIQQLCVAAPLHDIGKIGIPSHILKKDSTLNASEWEIMKTHPSIGETILSSYKDESSKSTRALQYAIDIAANHHEHWDGNGYPKGIKGLEIPIAARIMAVADTYDALISERVYKKPWTHEDARNTIIKNKNLHFDPFIVDAFILDQDQFISIANQYRDR